MPPYRFFLSYSWKNLGPPLRRFFTDVSNHVRDRVGGPLSEVSFRDRVTMKAGTAWPDGLFEALQTTQVLVFLHSVDYVQSDFCGKELEAFLARVRAFQRANPGEPTPLFIQPVMWITPAVIQLPSAIAGLQPEDDEFPEEYAKVGLQSLATKRDKAGYKRCVELIGDRIIKASQGDRLQPLTDYDTLESIPNAFTERPRVISASGGTTEIEVKCVYVAGKKGEIDELCAADDPESRRDVSCYGTDGWYWQPFNPPSDTKIGSVVQQMLTEYRYQEVPFGDNIDHLIDELRAAAERDEIVLLIVDAWSSFLQRYKTFLSRFDSSVGWNNAIIAPRNNCDEQTTASRATLDAQLRLLFRSKFFGPQISPWFRTDIHSIDDFRSVLVSVLEMIRSEIETRRAAQLQIEGPSIAQVRTSRERPDGT